MRTRVIVASAKGYGRRRARLDEAVRHPLDEDREGTLGCVSHGTIHTYRDFFLGHPPTCMAGHLAHEYAHLAGFRHVAQHTPMRKHTAPCAFGEIVYEVATRIARGAATADLPTGETILRRLDAWDGG